VTIRAVATAAIMGLVLAVAACGKYGPPVRTPPPAAPAAAPAAPPAPVPDPASDFDEGDAS
jgi:hypothetical protein